MIMLIPHDRFSVVGVTVEPSCHPHLTSRAARFGIELIDLQAKLAVADAARFVRGDLDERRHARVAQALSRKIDNIVAKLVEVDEVIDTTPLSDTSHVATLWNNATWEVRRSLLRLACASALLAKAPVRDALFNPDRWSYVDLTTD